MIGPLAVAAILLAHALIHLGYVAPAPPATASGPAWPFELGRSSLLSAVGWTASPAALRLPGMALVAATIAGFALAALGALGVLPTWAWTAGVAVGAVASLVLLLAFFHPWLVLGIGIDVVLLWAVLVARWTPTPSG